MRNNDSDRKTIESIYQNDSEGKTAESIGKTNHSDGKNNRINWKKTKILMEKHQNPFNKQ